MFFSKNLTILTNRKAPKIDTNIQFENLFLISSSHAFTTWKCTLLHL